MIAFTRSKRTQAEIIVITGNLSAAIKGKCRSVLRIDQEYADSITKEHTLSHILNVLLTPMMNAILPASTSFHASEMFKNNTKDVVAYSEITDPPREFTDVVFFDAIQLGIKAERL